MEQPDVFLEHIEVYRQNANVQKVDDFYLVPALVLARGDNLDYAPLNVSVTTGECVLDIVLELRKRLDRQVRSNELPGTAGFAYNVFEVHGSHANTLDYVARHHGITIGRGVV